MERNSRKVYVGVVVSNVNDKTITVKVEKHRRHPLYGKRVQYKKKFTEHDEQIGGIYNGSTRNKSQCSR